MRQILNVTDLQAFQTFVRLCTGSVGRLVNLASDFFESLEELRSLLALARPPRSVRARLVYGGDSGQKRTGVQVVPWSRVADTPW